MTDAPYISPLDQARILSEALPHMQRYDEETIVIKYGGHGAKWCFSPLPRPCRRHRKREPAHDQKRAA